MNGDTVWRQGARRRDRWICIYTEPGDYTNAEAVYRFHLEQMRQGSVELRRGDTVLQRASAARVRTQW